MAKSLTYTEGVPVFKKSTHLSKRKKLFILLIIVVVIGGVAYYIMSKMNGSDAGSVKNPTLTQQNAGLSFDFTPVAVNNAYVSFTYPRAMTIYPETQKASYPILENYEYKYPDVLTWLLVVTVTQLNSNSLMADTGYNYRVHTPDVYQQSTITASNNAFQVMTDTTAVGFGKVAFSLHNGMSCDISLLGNDNLGTANLQKVFSMVLESLSWH
jgi:hypothetical protein